MLKLHTSPLPTKGHKPSKLAHLSCCFALTSAFTGSLQATENESLLDLSISDLMNLKVTAASLFEESELDAASSITLLTSEDWATTNPHRVSDVLEKVPSVVSYPTWGGAEAIAIRGYATELSVRGIANTLNGVPLNTYVYATSLYDKPIINLEHLDRIEMVRGPGSTLFGSDAFHGVMAHQTRSEQQATRSWNVGGGTQGFAKGSTFVADKIGDVELNLGLAFLRQSPQELPYSYTSPDDGELYRSDRDYQYDDKSAFTTMLWGDASQHGRFKFTSYFASFNASGFPSSGTQFFVKLPNNFDLDSANITEDLDNSSGDSQFWLNSLEYQRQLNDQTTFEARAYHWTNKQQWSYENDRYPESLTLTAFAAPPQACRDGTNTSFNPLYCPHTLYQGADEQRSGLQLFLKGKHASTHWALGIGRDRFKVNNSRYQRIALDGTAYIDEANPYEGDTRNITYFLAQAKTGLMEDRLQLVYGVRVDRYSDLSSHTSPRLGAIFKVSDHYTTKLLYGHAFRAPTALEKLGSVDSIVANEDIKPEKIDTIEWVNLFYDQDYSLELTLFGSQWKDGIVLTPIVAQRNQYANTGDNDSYGLEVVGRKQLNAYQFNLAASYVKSRNKDFNIDYLAFPRWIFNLEANRLFDQHNIEIKLKQRIMLDHAEGDYITVINGSNGIVQEHIKPPKAKDYFRTDLSIVKHLGTLTRDGERSLSLSIKNLFDQENERASLYNAQSGISESHLAVDISLRWAW